NGAAALYPAVMAPAADATVVHQHRANGDAAFLQPQAGLVDGGLHEFVHTVSSFYLFPAFIQNGMRQHLNGQATVEWVRPINWPFQNGSSGNGCRAPWAARRMLTPREFQQQAQICLGLL